MLKYIPPQANLKQKWSKGFLEAQGIQVMLVQESIGRTLGLAAGKLGEVKILVPDGQVEQAKVLLQEVENGDFEDMTFSDTEDDQPQDK